MCCKSMKIHNLRKQLSTTLTILIRRKPGSGPVSDHGFLICEIQMVPLYNQDYLKDYTSIEETDEEIGIYYETNTC